MKQDCGLVEIRDTRENTVPRELLLISILFHRAIGPLLEAETPTGRLFSLAETTATLNV